MVIAELRYIERQVSMTPGLKKAIDFLRRSDIESLPDGKIKIDGDRVFAIIQRYETVHAPDPRFEYHRKYIDVQYVVSGEEMIGWAPAARMAVNEAYNADSDICFGTVGQGTWTPVYLQKGQMAVLYPEDGHAPKLAAEEPCRIMKIVVKVAAK